MAGVALRASAAPLVVAAALLCASTAQASPVRMNELQVVGTHNSYHREISPVEQHAYEQLIGQPGDYARYLAYTHVPLIGQLEDQHVRGGELDLWPDPRGGLYADPLVREKLGLGPLPDPAWRAAGIKVLHSADFDYNPSCVRFTACLRQIRAWSRAHPRHVPLLYMLELKQSDIRAVSHGGVFAPGWDGPALDTMDREIRSVFSDEELITADDVRRPGRTLEQSVLRDGWPALARSRGKVAFLLDNDPGPIRDAYIAGRPSLEGRAAFTNSLPGLADAAFVKRNDPTGANLAQIQDLVRRGYLVRTRSDVPLQTVLGGDTAQRDAALASGAQLVSTDFPAPGMTARYGSDYAVQLPGAATARCNPVNAPPGCAARRLEPRWDAPAPQPLAPRRPARAPARPVARLPA